MTGPDPFPLPPSVPNFILAFIPAEIHGDTLNTMTAFAVRASSVTTLNHSCYFLCRREASSPTCFCILCRSEYSSMHLLPCAPHPCIPPTIRMCIPCHPCHIFLPSVPHPSTTHAASLTGHSSFMGEHQDDDVHLVMVEPKRNILVGCVQLVVN